MSKFNPDVVKRQCSLPALGGVGARRVEACGHPSQKFLPASEHCIACVIASHNGGQAVDLPTARTPVGDGKE